jgi:hypothetical protein
MCAGTVRVARPTESGCALVLGVVKPEPSAGDATVTTVRNRLLCIQNRWWAQ